MDGDGAGDNPPSKPTDTKLNSGTFLDRAIAETTKAIEFDHNADYSAALRCYQNGLDYFLLALKYERNEASKDLIKAKLSQYLNRAEALKRYLEGTVRPKSYHPTSTTSTRENVEPTIEYLMSASYYRERAIQLSVYATEQDLVGRYTTASKAYEQALDLFNLSIKWEKDEQTLQSVQKRADRCSKRLNEIKVLLALDGDHESKENNDAKSDGKDGPSIGGLAGDVGELKLN